MSHVLTTFRAFVLVIFCIGTTAPVFADQSANNHLAKRKLVVEMLAISVVFEMDKGRFDRIDSVLQDWMHGQVDVLSAAVRKVNGEVISQAGDHLDHWTLDPNDLSTPIQVQVPLYEDDKRTWMVEIRFSTLEKSSPSSRLYFADVLALTISSEWLSGKQHHALTDALRRPVEEHRYVLSAAVRGIDGELIASAGDHEKHWRENAEDTVFARRLTAPVYRLDEEIATVEVMVKTLTVADVLDWLLF